MRHKSRRWLILAALGGAVYLSNCGGDPAASSSGDPCPQGICAGSTSSSGGSTSGGGSTSSGGGATSSTSITGSGGCVESWSCTPWDTMGNGDAGTRVCTDLNNCGTTDNKPTESATLPALDLEYFKCNVEPILDRKCSQLGCHGTEQGRALRVYSRGRLRVTGAMINNPICPANVLSDTCIGSNECKCRGPHTATEWQRDFDAARGFALDAKGAPIPAGQEDSAELIAQPIVGGKAHAGIHLFKQNDAEHDALKAWLGGAKLGMACNTGSN